MQSFAAKPVKLQSPDGQLELKFEVVGGIPQYSLVFDFLTPYPIR